MKHTRDEWAVYSRKDIEEMAMFAAKLRLIGSLYVGDIGEQTVTWREDGGIEVITSHTPASAIPSL